METPELLGLARIQGLTQVLEIIAAHLGELSGNKSLIWLASAFHNPFVGGHNGTVEGYRLKILQAANHLIGRNLAIYPIDARELISDGSLDVENRAMPPNSFSDFFALMELAKHSGGVAYFNTNGLWQAMQDAASTKKASYTLRFYTSEQPDNKFHSLRITTTEPDFHLRYRPGYWTLGKDQVIQSGPTRNCWRLYRVRLSQAQ